MKITRNVGLASGSLGQFLAGLAAGTAWILLWRLFSIAQQRWEAQMLDSGLSLVWWSVVGIYFAIDVVLLLSVVYVGIWAGWSVFFPRDCPFKYIALDMVMVVFLFHISVLTADHPVYAKLDALGLSHSSSVFLFAGVLWFVASILRARYIGRVLRGRSGP